MTEKEAYGQAFENGRKVGDAEGYAAAGDLISRKALLEKQYNKSHFNYPAMAEMVVDARDIEEAPAVAVQPVKRGQWLNWRGEPISPDDYWRVWRCSECGNEIEFNEAVGREEFTSNYCPNCGADMRGEDDGN